EVMVGFGRVGEWFAVNRFGVVPDLITFAKGVNSGYVPLGGVVISQRIASHFDTVAFQGGLTYSGHPLACAAGVATFGGFERDGILERGGDPGSRGVGGRGVRSRSAPACGGGPGGIRRSARCAGSGCSRPSSWWRMPRRARRS